MNTTRKQIVEALVLEDNDKGVLTLSKGFFTLRREYYWRPTTKPEEFFQNTRQNLVNKGFRITEETYGDHWASFRGGEGVKKNAHYWMRFKADAQV